MYLIFICYIFCFADRMAVLINVKQCEVDRIPSSPGLWQAEGDAQEHTGSRLCHFTQTSHLLAEVPLDCRGHKK